MCEPVRDEVILGAWGRQLHGNVILGVDLVCDDGLQLTALDLQGDAGTGGSRKRFRARRKWWVPCIWDGGGFFGVEKKWGWIGKLVQFFFLGNPPPPPSPILHMTVF